MNLARRSLPNLGSGRISRLATTLLLGMTSPLAKGLSGKPGTSVRSLLRHLSRTARPYSYQTVIKWVRRRNRSGFRTLGTVLGASLLTILYARGIEGAAHGVITHTRQVLDPPTADQHNRVLLKVMAFTADVGGHFETVGQTHTADLTQGRVRLLRGSSIDAGANTALLRTRLQRRYVAFGDDTRAWLAHELINGCHIV